MSRRRNLEHRLQSLAEVREIMNSLKTLAYMETRKLARFLDAQQAVVHSMETVAADFFSFHPHTLPKASGARPLYVLIGTERGFCGDFNHALLARLDAEPGATATEAPSLMLVGRRLHTLFEGDRRTLAQIDGASVVEETGAVLRQLADRIMALQEDHGAIEVRCLYHGPDETVVMRQLLPPFTDWPGPAPGFLHPPVLNLEPLVFLAELTDHYLFAALHAILYTSLMVENRQRVKHLDGAVNHLDRKSKDLARRSKTLRQEEIIEEIEVILLNASSLGGLR